MENSIHDLFSRMILIKEIGEKGLKKLRKATVAIVGVGGLGTHLALILTLSGVGHLKLIDPDFVEYSDINRQVLYSLEDLNLFKVEAARKRLYMHSIFTKIDVFPMMITPWNIERILKNVDIILDGTDNIASRYLINRYVVRHNIPYIYTAVEGFYLNVSFIKYPETPCLECFYKTRKGSVGVIPVIESTVSLAASIEANECIKYLLTGESNIAGKLLVGDLKKLSIELIELSKDERCEAHGGDYASLNYDYDLYFERDKIIFNPRDKVRVDLEPLTREIAREYILIRRGEVGIVFRYEKYKIGVSYSGNIVIKGLEDKRKGVNIIKKLVEEVFSKYVID